jgi:hypothetical protein
MKVVAAAGKSEPCLKNRQLKKIAALVENAS